MKLRFNYIFFFLIFLSLFGFGSGHYVSRTSVKSIKETEWVTKQTNDSKTLKNINLFLLASVVCSRLMIRMYERDLNISYEQKIVVSFLIQSWLYRKRDKTFRFLCRNSFPRLFTDDHNFSNSRAEFKYLFCSEILVNREMENYSWNHLLNREWLSQIKKSNLNAKEDLNGCLNGYI
jgi:hypothetical protein